MYLVAHAKAYARLKKYCRAHSTHVTFAAIINIRIVFSVHEGR